MRYARRTNAHPMAPLQQIPATAPDSLQTLLARLESSIRGKPTSWTFSLLAVGLLVRLWHASGTFLNPDEAMHFYSANQVSWWLTYRSSLTLYHPPLLILLLHAWRSLGTSEVVLRVPSILAGTAFCWFLYRWLGMLFAESVAWIGFVFALFLPSCLDLSTEIRQYALLLAFAMASAYWLERALAKNSVPLMLLSAVCLWLAILSHYSAFLLAAALAVYAILRMAQRRPSLRVFAAWEAGQCIALGLCYFLYVTHISRLGGRSGAVSMAGWDMPYLGNSYFVPGKMNPLLFIFARTGGVFQYDFGQSAVGDLAYPLFVAGMILLFRKPAPGQSRSWQLGVLLLLPFVLNCAAALARVYPYGGTRHSAFLLPFALAGASVALAHFLKNRLAVGVLAALLISLLCNMFPSHRAPYMSRQDQSSPNMEAALDFIHQNVALGEPIFTDYQTSLMLHYYLCERQPVAMSRSVSGLLSFDCGGHRVISADWNTFTFTPRSFADRWQILVAKYNLPPGLRVWVTQMGWSTHLAADLQDFPEFHFAPHFFGNRIQVFDLTVGQRMPDPEHLPTS
jgi:hypothetical protein